MTFIRNQFLQNDFFFFQFGSFGIKGWVCILAYTLAKCLALLQELALCPVLQHGAELQVTLTCRLATFGQGRLTLCPFHLQFMRRQQSSCLPTFSGETQLILKQKSYIFVTVFTSHS